MRKVAVVTQLTLDGVMQAPGGPEEDPSGGFEQGGWSVNYWDEVLEQAIGEGMARPFDLLLGRKTYEIFAAHWPYAEGPVAECLNSATKYVASRTLHSLDWSNSTLIEGEVETAVPQLKAEDGPELQVHGSSEYPPVWHGAGKSGSRSRARCDGSDRTPKQLTHEPEEETMVKVIPSRSMCLDGFIARPDDAMEWMFDQPGPNAAVEERCPNASPGCRQLDAGLTACRWCLITPDFGGHR